MKTVNPYVIFHGNAATAFEFYQTVFGGEIAFTLKAKDGPDGEKLSEEDSEKLLHICLPFKNGQVLMASDHFENMCGNDQKIMFNQGNTNFICISADDENEARDLFGKLSVDGQVMVPLEKMFWGDLFGQLTDQFGVQWMISAELPKPKQA